MIIKIINYHKDSGKPAKFCRSRMTKRTTPLNLSHEIHCLRKVSSNYKISEIFYDFLGDKPLVTRFLRKSLKSGNGFG